MNLLIGNAISLAAAYFTARSSWARDLWHIYMYQVGQCLLLAAASFFFDSRAGIVTLLVCALRNYLAANGRLTVKWAALCLVLVLIPGIALNNRGWVGAIVIGANVLYTVGMYLCKREKTVKWNIIINLILWMIYESLIIDLPSLAADGIGLVTAVGSLLRGRREEKKVG